jgi:MFS family permease
VTTAAASEAGRAPRAGVVSRHGVRAWPLVAVLAVTETVSWGVLYYALPVLIVPMREDLGWSTAELAGGLSLALVVSALTGIPVGRWLDRHPPRTMMLAGSVLGSGLVAAWSQVHSLLAFYLVWAGIGMAMAMVLYQAAFTALSKWFASRRRDALTALTLVTATASMIFSPLTNGLAAQVGWRDAVLALAIALAAITVPLHALLPHRSPPPATHPDAGADAQASGRAALRSSDFWLPARVPSPAPIAGVHKGPLPHGPEIAIVIPSVPTYGSTVPAVSPRMLTNRMSPSGLKVAPASSESLSRLTANSNTLPSRL